MSEHCQTMFNFGVEKYEERQREIAMFQACVDDAMESTRLKSSRRIDEFMQYEELVSNAIYLQCYQSRNKLITDRFRLVSWRSSSLRDGIMLSACQTSNDLSRRVATDERSLVVSFRDIS